MERGPNLINGKNIIQKKLDDRYYVYKCSLTMLLYQVIDDSTTSERRLNKNGYKAMLFEKGSRTIIHLF